METMTLMPMAAQVLDGRALPPVRASWTSGIGITGHVSDVNVTCPAVAAASRHFGTKAYGTRRLGEHAST